MKTGIPDESAIPSRSVFDATFVAVPGVLSHHVQRSRDIVCPWSFLIVVGVTDLGVPVVNF